MKLRITQWGNSLGIRIPKLFAVHLGVEAGEEINVVLKKNTIVISNPEQNSLDALLREVTPGNIHNETDTGFLCGKEIW